MYDIPDVTAKDWQTFAWELLDYFGKKIAEPLPR